MQFLHSLIGFSAHDSGITVFNIKLRLFASIPPFAVWQSIGSVTLLQQRISHISLIVENIINGERMPCCVSVPFRNLLCIQLIGNGLFAAALQVEMKNPTYNRRLRIINTKLSIYEFIPVSSSAAVEFAGFHSLLITPPHIFGNRF